MSGTNDDELKRDLRAAYGANLPGEEFDRRVLDRIDLDDGETEFSVPAPARTRLWPWAVAAAAILLILAGTPFAWRAVESKLPGAVLTPVSPVPMPVLPQAAPPAPRQPAALLILDVKADGSFRINGVACTREELEPVLRGEALRLRAQAAEDGVAESPVQVLVRAEEGVVWQRVQTIMQACADPSIRFHKFQFATPEDLADAPFERGTGALTIVVKGGGEIRVGSRTVPLARLAELLKLESSSSPRHVRDDGKWVSDLQVVIRADDTAGWGQIQGIAEVCADPEVRIVKVRVVTVENGVETARVLFIESDGFPAPGEDPLIVNGKVVRAEGGDAKIAVELKRTKDEDATRVLLLGREIGVGSAGFEALDREIAALTDDIKTTSTAEIHAWAWVPHEDVIRAIDAFMKSGIKDISFVGAPPPGAAPRTPPEDVGDPGLPKAGELVRINLFLKDGKILASFGQERVVHDLDAALKILDRILAAHKAAGRTPRGWIEAGVLISQKDYDRIMAVFTKHGVEDVVLVR